MHKIPLYGYSKICSPSPTVEFLDSSQTFTIMGNVALSTLLELLDGKSMYLLKAFIQLPNYSLEKLYYHPKEIQ